MSVQPQDLISHILHTARSIERMCDNEARQTGLTGSQARLLCFLSIVTLGQDIYGSSALCVKNGNGISGTPVQSSPNPA